MSRKADAGAARVTVMLGDREVALTLRQSDRARYLRLRMVPATGLEVVLPRGVARDDALRFVRAESAWVLRQVDALQTGPPILDIRHGARIPYQGGWLVLVMSERSRIRRAGDALHVPIGSGHADIERWYRAEARRICTEQATAFAAMLGVSFERIAIKDTRTRWGSCSVKGNLNFSWRLLLAPPEILLYVVAHEVAHLREMNHSPRFWAIVEQVCPQYRQHRKWLRIHGVELAAWPRVAQEHH